MKIRNQFVTETTTHLIVALRQPFWSAWQKYGWEPSVEGFGISMAIIQQADILKKKVQIKLPKYGSYDITPTKAMKFSDNKFFSRDNTPLIVIPRTAFAKL